MFSLHNEGQGLENLTSLPNLLKGMPMKDQELWLDVIMEAAGVNEHSENLEQVSVPVPLINQRFSKWKTCTLKERGS